MDAHSTEEAIFSRSMDIVISVIGRSETGIWIEGFSEAVWDDTARGEICKQKSVLC